MPKNKQEQNKNVSNEEILSFLQKIVDKQESFEDRMVELERKIKMYETGIDERFKYEAKEEDIKKAQVERKNVDPRIIKIVDSILGEDFSVRVCPNKDNPGIRLDIIVPPRLSLLEKRTRPVLNEDGTYKKDENGNVVMEEYQPEDVRSKMLSTVDSFDEIRKHCERIRANIVATYQKLKKPLPEFKLR